MVHKVHTLDGKKENSSVAYATIPRNICDFPTTSHIPKSKQGSRHRPQTMPACAAQATHLLLQQWVTTTPILLCGLANVKLLCLPYVLCAQEDECEIGKLKCILEQCYNRNALACNQDTRPLSSTT